MHPVALAAREGTDLALLRRPLEVEPRHVRARCDRPLTELDLVVSTGDFFPHRLVRIERFAALIDVANLHRLTHLERPGIRLLLSGDHSEERGLPRAVRTDHADDAAARKREAQPFDEKVVAVPLPEVPSLYDDITEPGAWRDVDFRRLDLLRRFLPQQLLVGVQTRLAFGLTRTRRQANPLELALQGALTPRLGLLLALQPLLLLLEPRRVVAFPRNTVAAVELEDPAGHVVEEISVVSDRDDRAGVILEKPLEPGHRLGVEMIGRLVEEQ